MVDGKFDLQAFLRQPHAVAALVSGSEVFGLLKRSLDLPPQWAALVTRTTGEQTLVPAGEVVTREEADEILLARTTPVDLTFEEDRLTTRDRFLCRADVRPRLSLIPDRGELASFHKSVLGSRHIVTTDDLTRYLQSAIRAALSRFAGERDVEALVDADAAGAAGQAIAGALEAACFSAGLTLEGIPTVQFDSRSFREVRRAEEEAVRSRQEHEASRELREALKRAQQEHLDHLAGMLARLSDLAAASPDVDLPDLVRSFTESQRGELYEALFKSAPPTAKTKWLVVAAAEEVLFFDPANPESPVRRVSLAGSAGPVRSIQTVKSAEGRYALMLGAATGVYRLPLDAHEPDVTLLADKKRQVRGGFNAVAVVDDRVFASHSELGLWCWRLAEAGAGGRILESMTREAKAVRGVQCFDVDLYCAIDDRVLRCPADEVDGPPSRIYTGSAATITALRSSGKGLFAGNSDGEILHWAEGDQKSPEILHAGSHRAVESIWLLSTHGVQRLLFTDTSIHAHARVLSDNFSCRYEAGGQTLRRLEVADDLLVATNDVRDRLFCWKPGEPERPSVTISVAAIARHSIQDVCLVPAPPIDGA